MFFSLNMCTNCAIARVSRAASVPLRSPVEVINNFLSLFAFSVKKLKEKIELFDYFELKAHSKNRKNPKTPTKNNSLNQCPN